MIDLDVASLPRLPVHTQLLAPTRRRVHPVNIDRETRRRGDGANGHRGEKNGSCEIRKNRFAGVTEVTLNYRLRPIRRPN